MSISEQRTSEIIKSFEEKKGLFSLQVRGVCVWRVFRSSVFSRVQNLGISGEDIKRKDVVLAALRSIPTLLYAVLIRNKLRYGVVSYPFALRDPNNEGSYDDCYYQEIINEIPGGVRLLNGPILRSSRKAGGSVLSLDLSIFSLISLVLARLFPIESKDGAYAKIATAIAGELRIAGITEVGLKRWFSIFWWESKVKGLFFRALGIEFILTINSSEYIITNSAIANGIETIELQHGIYTANHPDVLPNGALLDCGQASLFFPNVIALYGDYWADQLRPIYDRSPVEVVTVGNNICDSLRDRRARNYPRIGSSVTVLVTTQGIQRTELIEFIKNVLALSSTQISFIIKLHPIYDKDKSVYVHEFAGDNRVKVASGDEHPSTAELLTTVDFHASIASMCHFDALSMGVPTVVIGLPGYELVLPIVRNGSAVLVVDPAAMMKLIDDRKWIDPTPEMQQYYCKSGFVENIKKLID